MGDDLRRVTDAAERARAIARALADTAEQVASTLDDAAEIHDRVAANPSHPLHDGAAARAEEERRFAAHERQEAARYSAIADGEHP